MAAGAFGGGGGAGDEEWGLDATRRDERAGERSARAAGERRRRAAAAMGACGFRFGGDVSFFSLFFSEVGARGGLGPEGTDGYLYGRWMTGGAGEGRDGNAGARVGAVWMTGGVSRGASFVGGRAEMWTTCGPFGR